MNTLIKNGKKYLVVETEKTNGDGSFSNIENHLYLEEAKPEVKGLRLSHENQIIGNMLRTELLIRAM